MYLPPHAYIFDIDYHTLFSQSPLEFAHLVALPRALHDTTTGIVLLAMCH